MYQNFPSSPWSTIKEISSQETFEIERKPQYVYVDVHGAEIAEIKERIEKLEKKLEEREGQQIIPVQFLDSEKLELKKPIYVSLSYGVEDEVWIIDCPELNIYGSGQDETEAVKDFKIILEEKYFDLKQDKAKLGPALQQEWSLFNKIVKEK